jgi:DNA repair photolyase
MGTESLELDIRGEGGGVNERLQAIYEPKGKAREYADWAVNLYTGCTHGCVYCYAPQVLHMDRAAFHSQCIERPGILDKLRHDAELLASSGNDPVLNDPVLFCFTSDAYQPGANATRAALCIMREFDIQFSVLTKGARADRDFDLYGKDDCFGMTLTCLSPTLSLSWEPRAAIPDDRFALLMVAHSKGIRTWASLEPVIDPQQTLAVIDETHRYVDHYAVGKLNYHPLAKTIDWAKFLRDVLEKLKTYGNSYYIKESLRAYEVYP